MDMVSPICPLCKIDLVEATNDTGTGLYVAEETAATTLGAKYISNSWGGGEDIPRTRPSTRSTSAYRAWSTRHPPVTVPTAPG